MFAFQIASLLGQNSEMGELEHCIVTSGSANL